MAHPQEHQLRDLYALFAQGNIPAFLAGCTDDVTFSVSGSSRVSGEFRKETFGELLKPVMEISRGTFSEEVLDIFANDEHGVVLLVHRFERDGQPQEYRTAHIVQLRNGQIAAWREHPGDERRFQEAWG